ESNLPVWIRTPIIPGYTDSEANIREIARFIVDNIPNIERYELLAFNKMCIDKYKLFELEYPLKDIELVSKEKMEKLAEIARHIGVKNVVWSGMTKSNDLQS
ncbi:MAG: hypothetical protein ACFE7R_10085, partial [Candidatus Hodarchaeota archaeon]